MKQEERRGIGSISSSNSGSRGYATKRRRKQEIKYSCGCKYLFNHQTVLELFMDDMIKKPAIRCQIYFNHLLRCLVLVDQTSTVIVLAIVNSSLWHCWIQKFTMLYSFFKKNKLTALYFYISVFILDLFKKLN